MSWIDLRVKKPTAEDADTDGKVFVRVPNGEIKIIFWSLVRPDDVAWMPIPEFRQVPDPPEGYEILQDYNAEPKVDAMYWSTHGQWLLRDVSMRRWTYNRDHIYAVPIKTPKPQYRPFQNAEEFKPFRERWWRCKDRETLYPPGHYNDSTHHGYHWDEAFEKFEFEDGTPFGLPIN